MGLPAKKGSSLMLKDAREVALSLTGHVCHLAVSYGPPILVLYLLDRTGLLGAGVLALALPLFVAWVFFVWWLTRTWSSWGIGLQAPQEDQEKKPGPLVTINWKRGLVRLWSLLSILWVVGAGWIAIDENSPMERVVVEAGSIDTGRSTTLDVSGLTPVDSVVYVRDWSLPDWEIVVLIIGAPLLVFWLGMALAWVIGGFRDSHEQSA